MTILFYAQYDYKGTTFILILSSCGLNSFNSRATFYRLFRERYKINPAEYRRIARKP
jgi:transcriptional regulator GlxA family with amidase domain